MVESDALLKGSRTIWYLGCLLMPLAVVRLWGATVSDIAFALATLILIPAVRYRRPAQVSWMLATLLTLLATGICRYRSLDIPSNDAVGLRLVLLFVAWKWLSRSCLGHEGQLRCSIIAYMMGCSISAGVGAWQAVTGLAGRASGLSGHSNIQGGELALAVCFGIGLLLVGPGGRLVSALTVTSAIGILLAGSITGMMAGGAGALILLIRAGISTKTMAWISVVVGTALVTASRLQERLPGYDPATRFASATGSNGDTSTLRARLDTDQFAWAGIRHHFWVGVGLDPASGVTTAQNATHNLILLAWFQGGVLLLAAISIALAGPIRFAWSRRGGVTESLSGGLFCTLIYAQTAPVLFFRYFWFPGLLLLVAKDLRLERAFCPAPKSESAYANSDEASGATLRPSSREELYVG